MTTEAVDRAIEDAREANTEIHLKDPNGKVSHKVIKSPKRKEEQEDELENSKLELSNLSSSTEIEQETKEHNLRRSKQKLTQ